MPPIKDRLADARGAYRVKGSSLFPRELFFENSTEIEDDEEGTALERTIMQTKIFALAALLCSTALAAVEDTYEPADSKVNVSTGLRSLGLTIPHYFPVTLPV